MTQKHFQALARALAETSASLQTVQAIANVCAADNPRFDRVKFLRAAGQEIAAQGAATLKSKRADYCPDCGYIATAHTGTYCHNCGATL